MLKVLREKALEREALFDNVEARLVGERSGEAPVTTTAFKAHLIRSGKRRLLTVEYEPDNARGGKGDFVAMAVASERSKTLGVYGRTAWGIVTEPGYEPMLLDVPLSPDVLGVTALPIVGEEGEDNLGTLARFLDPETANPSVATRDLRLVGRETVSGRELLVVEEKLERPLRDDPKVHWEHTARLYFDPAMNYACVMVDTSGTYGGAPHSRLRCVMSDFREVKPGLLVPFALVEEWKKSEWKGDPAAQWTKTYKVESLEFREGFDEGVFDVEFPAGTQVFDTFVKSRYTVGAADLGPAARALLEPDLGGEGEAESPAQAAANVQVTTPAATGAVAVTPAGRSFPVAWVAAVLMALVLIGAAIFLRRLGKKREAGG
jgi:hypothetical protein